MLGKELKRNILKSKTENKAEKKGKARKTKLPSLKNQIRGVQRLLAKVGTDPKVRQKQELKLQDLLVAKQQHELAERERKFAKKYHKVRFFERVKIERRLYQLKKQTSRSAEEQAQLQQLQEDLKYVLYFPKGEKYVSLLKDGLTAEEQKRLEQERTRLRALVRKQLTDAALLAEADEGRAMTQSTVAVEAAEGVALQDGLTNTAEDIGFVADADEEDDFFLNTESKSEEVETAEKDEFECTRAIKKPPADRRGIDHMAVFVDAHAAGGSKAGDTHVPGPSLTRQQRQTAAAVQRHVYTNQKKTLNGKLRQTGALQQQARSCPSVGRTCRQKTFVRRHQQTPLKDIGPAAQSTAGSKTDSIASKMGKGSQQSCALNSDAAIKPLLSEGLPLQGKQQRANLYCRGATHGKVIEENTPLRTRAEGGRKRRRRNA